MRLVMGVSFDGASLTRQERGVERNSAEDGLRVCVRVCASTAIEPLHRRSLPRDAPAWGPAASASDPSAGTLELTLSKASGRQWMPQTTSKRPKARVRPTSEIGPTTEFSVRPL